MRYFYSVASDSEDLGRWLSKATPPTGGGGDRLLIHTFLGPLVSWPGKNGSSRMITLFLILGSGPKKSDLKNIEALGEKEESGADRVLQIMKSRLVLSRY